MPGLEVSVRSSSIPPAFRCINDGVLAICVNGLFGSRIRSALDPGWGKVGPCGTARDAMADALAR